MCYNGGTSYLTFRAIRQTNMTVHHQSPRYTKAISHFIYKFVWCVIHHLANRTQIFYKHKQDESYKLFH